MAMTLQKLVDRYGAVESSEMLGVSRSTLWRWLGVDADGIVEMNGRTPSAVIQTVRRELTNVSAPMREPQNEI